MTENLKRTLLYNKEKITFLGTAKLLICAVAILNMISIPTYSDALLLLENEICGFMLFGFMLFGLVAIFGAIRLDPNKLGRVIFLCISLALALFFAALLLNIMLDALYNQLSLTDPVIVADGINFGIMICSGYGIGLVAAPVAYWLDHRKNRKTT
ncbi:MAG: hypothetical protein R3Y06_09065 [Faecalibacterium sp.]